MPSLAGRGQRASESRPEGAATRARGALTYGRLRGGPQDAQQAHEMQAAAAAGHGQRRPHEGRTDGRPYVRTPAGRHRLGGARMRRWLHGLRFRAKGAEGRGMFRRKGEEAAGGPGRGRVEPAKGLETPPGSGSGQKVKDVQRGARSERGKGRGWERSRTELSAGMETARRRGLEHGGDAGAGSQRRAVSDPTPDFNEDLLPRPLPVRPRSAGPRRRAWRPRAPPVLRSLPARSSPRAARRRAPGAERGRIRRAPPWGQAGARGRP